MRRFQVPTKAEMLVNLKENLSLYGRYFFPRAFTMATPPFHQEVCKALANTKQRLTGIAAPRGSAKSTLVSFLLVMHTVIFKKSTEDVFIVIVSEGSAQSINFLSRIKNALEESERHKAFFGDYGEHTAKRWRENEIVLKNGARIIAVGARQRVRGFIHNDVRPTLVVVDDFESETNAATPEARAYNRKWMTEALIPSMARTGRMVMIGTVISDDCFLMWIKDSEDWKVLWYSIIDQDTNESIWPEEYPMDRILSIKRMMASVGNINGFYQEYLNIAQSPESAPFKPSYLRMHQYQYKKLDNGQQVLWKFNGGEEEQKPVDLYMGVDPASSLSIKADYFVIVVLAVDSDGNVYIVDKLHTRLNPAEQPQTIVDMYLKYHPRKVRIETVAYQEALRAGVKALTVTQGIYIPGIEKGVKPRNSKSERLLSMVPLLASGKFYFRTEDTDIQTEFWSFPKGKHDDYLDAIWTALYRHKPCRVKKLNKKLDKKVDNYSDWYKPKNIAKWKVI